MKKIFLHPIFVAITLTTLLVILFLFLPPLPFNNWDFRNNLWSPSRLLVTGRSPYYVKALFPLTNAVWMPTIIGMFFPLGWLPEAAAAWVWLSINLLSLAALLRLYRPGSERSLTLFGLLALLLTFPPTITHITLGQISILIALLFVLAARTSSPLWRGLLVALALAKPQLCLLALPGLFLQDFQKGGARRALYLGAALLGWSAVLTLPLFIAYPNWIPAFLFDLTDNSASGWAQPSTLAFFMQQFGPTGGWLAWGVLALAVFALNTWLWFHLPADKAIAWSLALTCLATPYLWPWDFTLLLPCLLALRAGFERKQALWLLFGGFILGFIVMWAIRWNSLVSNEVFSWVPWAFIGLFALSVVVERQQKESARKQSQISLS